MTNIIYGDATHVGCVRESNEDFYCADADLGLWLVADGMGGHEAGEVASRIAVDFIREHVHKGVALLDAVASAHEVVRIAAEQGLGQVGMGATLVALKLVGSDYELVWVGDSRAYLWSHGALTQLTRDHSLVQQLLDAGQIEPEDAASHPYRNCVTQALGAADIDAIEPGHMSGTLYAGERVLLCSDGLTGEVSDSEIAAVLCEEVDEQSLVDQLIAKALEFGGSDNVTVLLVSAPADAPCRPVEDETIPLTKVAARRAVSPN